MGSGSPDRSTDRQVGQILCVSHARRDSEAGQTALLEVGDRLRRGETSPDEVIVLAKAAELEAKAIRRCSRSSAASAASAQDRPARESLLTRPALPYRRKTTTAAVTVARESIRRSSRRCRSAGPDRRAGRAGSSRWERLCELDRESPRPDPAAAREGAGSSAWSGCRVATWAAARADRAQRTHGAAGEARADGKRIWRLVVSVAKRYSGSDLTLLDLVQKQHRAHERRSTGSSTGRVQVLDVTRPGGFARPSPATPTIRARSGSGPHGRDAEPNLAGEP